MRKYYKGLMEKWNEALKSVLPVIGIVLLLCFTAAPLSTDLVLTFLVGAVLLMAGMMFFSLGADISMTPIGEKVGAAMTKSRKILIIVALGFVMGFIITVSEPDLQVLAGQVPSVPNMTLILSVALGVAVFLVIALLRMLLRVPLSLLLIVSYTAVFILSAFVPDSFLSVAFDSGGVTTGPMTVPFIMALGVGVSSMRSDERAADDSFGLVALSSIGPILSVLILGLVYNPREGAATLSAVPTLESTTDLTRLFLTELPHYMKEIAVSLLPIVVFFGLFQIFSLKLTRRRLVKILVGLGYTYVGLVLFLTGANVGFMPVGSLLGEALALLPYNKILVPVGMLIGYFIVKAEPAVHVLTAQVEALTDGAVSAKAIGSCLSVGVSVSVGLAMVRVLSGISILWFLVPGYAVALALSFLVPKIFTAIAFDSGGVASGPMTATFLLPLAQGACRAVGGNVTTDAFGVVAMVAMTPLITIQCLGLAYRIKLRNTRRTEAAVLPPDEAFRLLEDDAIINL